MMVYLAGAIDLVSGEERENWRKTAIEWLMDRGISAYNPVTAFAVNLEDEKAAKSVVAINEAALAMCDFAIFVMSPTQPSVGTPIELFQCSMMEKPRVVVWVADWTKPLPAYLSCYGGKIVGDLDRAMASAVKFLEGNVDWEY